MKTNITKIVNDFRDKLEQQGIHVEKIFLYGSQRWNTAVEGSDIDLTVISSDWEKLTWRERRELMGVMSAGLMEPIQAHGWTNQEITDHQIGSFWEEILEKEAIAV